ncbi:MAG: SapC family protein [Betaproteobacteria bacterium]
MNKARHEGKKIKQVQGFGFASDFHIASIMVHEFARASSLYPVVFLEDKEQDSFRPVVLMGMDAGENLFVGADGKWQASYVPAIIRRYPFALASAGEEGKFTVCIDEGSELISETEGVPLFNEQGEPAEALENVKRYLGELQQMDAFTNEFCKYMVAHNMLTPLNMRVQQADQVKNINGCYVINEERLNGLSADGFMELREKRYLPAVYAHLLSLAQIERLITLKDERLAALLPAA